MPKMKLKVALSMSDDDQEQEHQRTLEKTGFWGHQAAGCLFLAKNSGRLLFAHRSPDVSEPGTWGSWRGALDEGEAPVQGVTREIKEETQYNGRFQLVRLSTFSHPSGFQYHNFLAVVP